MAVGSHLRALLWKNWLLWKRNLAGSLCELLFPILLLLGLLAIRFALPPEDKDAKSYLDDGEKIVYLYSNETFDSSQFDEFETPEAFRWCHKTIEDDSSKWTFAFVPKDDTTVYLAEYINSNFVGLPDGIDIMYFDDEDDLEDYITDSDYDDDDSLKLCFAVVIDTLDASKVDYKIRFNSTDTDPDNQTVYGRWLDIFMTTRNPNVNKFDRKVETQYQTDFLKSGFMQIMNVIDNYILNDLFQHADSYITYAYVPMHGQDYVEDNFTQRFAGVLGFFMFVTSMVPVARMIGRIVTEKETKVREAMKMMGLTDTPYWLSWVIMYTIIYLISAIGCTLIGIPIFKYSNKFVVFLIFFLYGLSCISFCMLISSFFTKAKTAILVGIVAFFVSYFSIFAVDETTTTSVRMTLSLFNTIAMALGFFTLLTFEGIEEGINFDNLDSRYLHTSVQDCLIMLVVDTAIYALLAFYFDKVIPSEYGTKLPWYFPFSPSYWRGRSMTDNNLNDQERTLLLQEMNETRQELQENIERVDNSLQRQIESGKAMVVRGLRKHFGNKIAVDGIDMEMYEGQIFALLGHNGAGKTTTLSMLTGMLGPTAGEMTVNKLKFDSNMSEIRQKLGVCPQHDVLFKELTVTEHLYMFARFKGMKDKAEIEAAVNEKIREVDLEEKKNTQAMNLSGGQRRKLSLAIALIGGSTIIMLDEPTSGMDLTARRKMWDMLKNAKQGRIIILTTHYMEEADILADRIAIMAEGKVRCLGSSLFLKNRYGVGYNLSISKKINVSNANHSKKVIEIVNQHIPDAELLADASAEISFQLPLASSARFKDFFTDLDRNLDNLDLLSYAISVTTLEEVFLRVARGDQERGVRKSQETLTMKENILDLSKEHTTQINVTDLDNPDKDFNIAEHRVKKMLFLSHFWALIKKRWIYSLRDYKGLLMEILLPIIVITLGLALLTQFSLFVDQEKVDLLIDLYDTPQSIMYNYGLDTDAIQYDEYLDEFTTEEVYIGDLNDDSTDPVIKRVMNIYQDQQGNDVELYEQDDDDNSIDYLDELLYDERDSDPYRYGSYYFAKATSNETVQQFEVVVFQNSSAYQSIPVFTSAMSKAILSHCKDPDSNDPDEYTYEVANHPLPLTKKQESLASNAGSFYVSMIFAVGIAFIPTGVITYIVKEKENNVKHQHLVSGVSIPAYWISNFFWDILKYEFVAVISVLMITAFDLQSMTENSEVYGAAWVIFIVAGPAIISFAYVFSFLFKTYSMAQFTIFMHSLLFGAIVATITSFLKLINEDTRDAADVLQWIFRILSPVFCFSYGLMNISNREAHASAYGDSSLLSPYDIDIAGGDILMLGIEGVLFSFGVFFLEWMITAQWWRKLASGKDPGENDHTPDDDVVREKEEVKQTSKKDVAVKVAELRKVYSSLGSKDVKVAIQELSFLVHYQECFALLGTNGAGKTSTFKILTGEYGPTSGKAFIAGKNVVTKISEARYNIGYCPQYDALTELLTPIEHLELYGSIKGIPPHLIKPFAKQKLDEMGLTKYEHVRAGALSGGNKRKLSVAVACIGNPPVVFLDEPSAGMDPGARKQMWKVINDIKIKKCSIILTTHSMDEAEALCDRISIMVAGRSKCLGTATHIKNKFGSGYEFLLKVRQPRADEIARNLELLNSNLGISQSIPEAKVTECLQLLNCVELGEEIKKGGFGGQLYQEIQAEKSVSAHEFVEWCIIESFGQRIYEWLRQQFKQVVIIEHFLTFYKFKVEKEEGQSLGFLFGVIEENREALNISEYSLSQTSLEQIFNMFATQTDDLLRSSKRMRQISGVHTQ